MVMIVKTTDEYFYERQRDLLILEMKINDDTGILINQEKCIEEAAAQLEWFKARGIETRMMVPTGVIVGWYGHYYIDIDPSSGNSILDEYTKQWENDEGYSLRPDVYQMIALSYKDWINKGGKERHEQHMRDLEDPNYEP